jgi:hypothetical protein
MKDNQLLLVKRRDNCVDCPRDGDDIHPERCANSNRYDHSVELLPVGSYVDYNDLREIARKMLGEGRLVHAIGCISRLMPTGGIFTTDNAESGCTCEVAKIRRLVAL